MRSLPACSSLLLVPCLLVGLVAVGFACEARGGGAGEIATASGMVRSSLEWRSSELIAVYPSEKAYGA